MHRRSRSQPNLLACAAAAGLFLLVGCAGRSAAEPEPELAVFMGELQRFSQKLGYAIEGRNQPLAAFYAHEIEEVLEQLIAVQEHDGLPIGSMAQTLAWPTVEPLRAAIDAADWSAADAHYPALIRSCNTCHQATKHQFIEILPASDPPPFNQKFTAQ